MLFFSLIHYTVKKTEVNDVWKQLLQTMKSNKRARYATLLGGAIILILLSAVLTPTPEENQPAPENNTPIGYDTFSEKQEKDGMKAAEIAEKAYKETHGELRDTSFFYAEHLSGETYHVVGIDALDGRDVTFIEYEVDVQSKTAIEKK